MVIYMVAYRFITSIFPSICASAMTLQRLVEAAWRYAKVEAEILEYMREFEDIFAKESFDTLPEWKPWDHAIELEPGSKPTNCKVYPLSPREQVELNTFLQENLHTGRIRLSKSPMASPVFFIKKKDGSLQLVQDYQALNAVTIKNWYSILLISGLIVQLCCVKYFTKLDVHWGFNNMWICHGDEWKATFCTNHRLFEPQVMFFGLTNSPTTFQTMMNDIFRDMIAEGVVCVHLDDILIFTKTLSEHRNIVWRVLEHLWEHKLYLKLEKCKFEWKQIEYSDSQN